MNMKKIVMIGLVVVCVVMAAVAFSAGDKMDEPVVDAQVQETMRVEGLVVTVQDGSFILLDKDLGEIQVNLSDATVFEGVIAEELSIGQYVFVDFDGKMTRSLPPQISAMQVGMYPVSGVVTEVTEERVTVEQSNGNGEAVIHLLEGAPELNVGDEIIAYTNGAMTMSLPPQTTALAIHVMTAAQ